MQEIFEQIQQLGILPVIKISDPSQAVPLGRALCAGGLPAAEITFRTPCAADAIAVMARECPDMLIGAGTILSVEQAEQAVSAGAKFLVSPGFNPRVVDWCAEHHVTIIPGCVTPTEIEAARDAGLRVVKFFPAEPSGGLAMISALSAPYADMRFLPTGGISEKNLAEYLAHPAVIACGGSFMVKESLLAARDFAAITALTRSAVLTSLGLRLTGASNGVLTVESVNPARARALFGECDTFRVNILPAK